MITENLSTLKIHKLSQAQYDRELEAGNIDASALYLTPGEEISSGGSEWELVTDITLTADSSIAEIKYDQKYNIMHAQLIIPKVTTPISTGNSTTFLHGYGLYYTTIGSTSYPWRGDLICEKRGNEIFEQLAFRAMSGVGTHAQWSTRCSPATFDANFVFSCRFNLTLPAGTVLRVYGRE